MIVLSPEVTAAIQNSTPVVALESTLISHGLPYPKNLELARQVEDDVRAGGATPATIAVIEGCVHVGLSDAQIEFLATGDDILKLNAADIGLCCASGHSGATTVAGTMACAAQAGIKFFATGGIGGVHRGAELSFDISQDLTALKTYPVAVITAGAKSILDLPKTLEVLETYGVPVIGFQTDHFPAFWTRSSGLALTWRADSPAQIAEMAREHWTRPQSGGLVIANPVPQSLEIPVDQIEAALTTALDNAEAAHIRGKPLTPYLLRAMREILPRTESVNIELIRHNVRTGTQIAVASANLPRSVA